jgi:hypothetical protein
VNFFVSSDLHTEWLITAVALGIIGALLIVLAPGKHIAARDAAA